MDRLWQDVRYGLGGWRRAPGFTAVVVLTLAFGIAANTVVFSVINSVFLEPLPVARPDGLALVRGANAAASRDALPIAYPNLKDLRARNRVFSDLAGYSSPTTLTLLEGNRPERLFAELVTGNYFDTLGLVPARGRFFRPEEDAVPGADAVLVMAYSAWQRRFGGDPGIVGRTLRLNGGMFTVIGVAPEGFKGVDGVFGPDVWIPTMMAAQVLPAQSKDWLQNRSAPGFYAIGRLKPHVSRHQAAADLDVLAASLDREYPDADRGWSLTVEPATRAVLMTGGRFSAGSVTIVLLLIPALILLIACSNVANLLLVRAAGRRREIAVRLALGSGRRRLVSQLFTESLMLATISGAAGFALAYAGGRLLWSFRPADVAGNLVSLDINGTVLLFTAIVSIVTAVLFGLVPAWRSARTDVVHALNEEARAAGPSPRAGAVSRLLLGGQVALSLVSLITAGLLIHGLQRAYSIDPGFETHQLGIALMSPGQAGYDRVRTEQFYRDVRTRIAAVPGVLRVSWATDLPLFSHPSRSVTIPGRAEDDPAKGVLMTVVNAVDTGYFATTGIGITRGREFRDSDHEGTAPVAVINETLAARAWPGLDPIGRYFQVSGNPTKWQVVGVAKTANYGTIGEPPEPCVYLPLQQAFSDSAVLYVRTAGDPAGVLATVQAEVRHMDSRIDVDDVRTIQTVIGQALFGATIGVALLGVFGLVALGLASLGLYGAMAHAVGQRQREIGVRIALGAPRRAVVGLILRQGLAVVAAGMVIGSLGAWLTGAALARLLYGVSAADPISQAGASLVLLLTATVACAIPAYRASRMDPLKALRE